MRGLVFIAALFASAAACAKGSITDAPAARSAQKVTVETVASGLDFPWGLTFLPDGEALVTERPGRMRVIQKDGALSAPVEGVPKVVFDGQGGLLDVVAAPDFAKSQLVYFTFSEARGGGANSTSAARAKLIHDATGAYRLENLEIIFRQDPPKASPLHFGSRIVFTPDGSFFLTLGERAYFDVEAQNTGNDLGKVVRLLPDGKPYPGNPKKPGWRPEIWSIGHRNIQGAALNPATGALWTTEHGAKGGDELNAPEAGKNYGWPVISYGVDYSGAKLGIGTKKAGMEQPIYYWDPSIAPSGLEFYAGDKMPEWKGDLFAGALAGQALHRLVLDGEHVIAEEVLLQEQGARVRTVRQGPDGYLWLVFEAGDPDGRVVRVVPAP